MGAALVPVAFSYGGWQTATFIAGEMRNPARDLSRGLVLGVAAVVLLYLSVNFVCVKVLGPEALDRTATPAADVIRKALGERGALFISAGISVSALGFLSHGILTAPRVYHVMARDGLFFSAIGRVSASTGAPVAAILLQGIAATLVATSGKYEQILNYEISVDSVAFALTGAALFVFRHRKLGETSAQVYRTPGHPYTTAMFVLVCAGLTVSAIRTDPLNSLIALAILLSGIPVYLYRSSRSRPA
jgi:APA family basic amino acid/polyamine antiporter